MALPVSESCPAVYRSSQRPSLRFRRLPSPLALRFAILSRNDITYHRKSSHMRPHRGSTVESSLLVCMVPQYLFSADKVGPGFRPESASAAACGKPDSLLVPTQGWVKTAPAKKYLGAIDTSLHQTRNFNFAVIYLLALSLLGALAPHLDRH